VWRCMTAPRQYLLEKLYLLTRCTLMRQFTFRPDPAVERIWLYCLAVYAERYGIELCGFALMSTHEHLLAIDHRGTMELFLRDFHRTVTKALQVHLGFEGPVWEDKPTSVVELKTMQAFVEEGGYVVAQPVEAEAVEYAHQWPGLLTLASQMGNKTFTVERPPVYFSKRNKKWPKMISLTLGLPTFEGYSDEEVRELIGVEAERLEHEARDRMKRSGRKFQGAKRVATVSREARATKPKKRGDRNPTFAVGRDNPEALAQAAFEVKEFRRRYQEALNEWRNGNHAVEFPPGTVVMRRVHNARVAAA
jgi:putative transposase